MLLFTYLRSFSALPFVSCRAPLRASCIESLEQVVPHGGSLTASSRNTEERDTHVPSPFRTQTYTSRERRSIGSERIRPQRRQTNCGDVSHIVHYASLVYLRKSRSTGRWPGAP